MRPMSVQRTCIGCRRTDEQADLIRLVRVGGDVVDGTTPRLPGRGAYLHRDLRCLDLAEQRRAIARALGVPGGVPPRVREKVAMEQVASGQ